MILYFSATGNSEYAARMIADAVDDVVVSLTPRLKTKDHSPIHSEKPWIIVTPIYAWRIPEIVTDLLNDTPLTGNRQMYFVLTHTSGCGNASDYARKLAEKKGMVFMGLSSFNMPSDHITMFETPSSEEAEKIIQASTSPLSRIAQCIQCGEMLPARNISIGDRIASTVINPLFCAFMTSSRGFHVTDKCVGCGLCVQLYPLNNIVLVNQKPQWSDRCTHCTACINHCPTAAIEYGRKTKGRHRYVFPKDVMRKTEQDQSIGLR